jgi:hypothetical protein
LALFRVASDEGYARAFDAGGVLSGIFAEAEAVLGDLRVWRLAVAALLVLQSALILTHSAWLDEWQALQIALQSPSLSALLQNLHYEGHPSLWYVVLRSVALVVPYLWVLAIAQLVVAVTMQALILSRAPFGRLERLLIGGSLFILFEFGTLSRSLGLGALLTIAFFAARDRRVAWTTLILLPNVDIFFGMLSIVGLALTIREGRFSICGACLWLISSLFAAWTVIPPPDIQPALDLPPLPIGVIRTLSDFSALLIPFQTVDNRVQWGGGVPWGIGPLTGILFILFAMRQLRDSRLHTWVFAGFLSAMVALTLFIYPLGLRHLTLIPLLLILLKWREVPSGAELDNLFRLWLVVIALGGTGAVAISINRPFDQSPRVARFIRSNHLEDKHWVSFPDSMASGAAGLLDREFHTLRKGCTQSFLRWDFRDRIEQAKQLDYALKQVAGVYGRFYLISSYDLDSRITLRFRQIAHFPEGYDGRAYYLYVISPELPESSRRPPPCAPSRIRLGEASLLPYTTRVPVVR